MRRASAILLLLAQALVAACGASTPATTPATTAAAGTSAGPVVITDGPIDREAVRARGATLRSPTPDEPRASARAADFVDRARTLYRDLEFERSLAAVGEAQRILEQAPSTEEDLDTLHTALVYRAMNEQAQGHRARAREALRAAAALRPDTRLDEGSYPPDVRTLHAQARAELRAEQPVAVAITTEPAGARLAVDGRDAGTSPATVHGSPAQHFLRVAAVGHAPRVLSVDFAAVHPAPLHVELPGAGADETARQLSALSGEELAALTDAERTAISEALAAPAVVTVRRTEDGFRAFRLELVTGELDTAAGPGPGSAVDALLARVSPPTAGEPRTGAEEGGDTPWESPWLWTGVGAAVAAGVVSAILLTRDPGHRVVVDANP